MIKFFSKVINVTSELQEYRIGKLYRIVELLPLSDIFYDTKKIMINFS